MSANSGTKVVQSEANADISVLLPGDKRLFSDKDAGLEITNPPNMW